jgi:hypothetical protein
VDSSTRNNPIDRATKTDGSNDRSDSDVAQHRGLSKLPGETWAHGSLLLVALAVAWLPVETRPMMAIVVSAVIVGLGPWGWRHDPVSARAWLVVGAIVVAVLTLSSVSGWDPATGVGWLGLGAAVGSLVWLASRSCPPAIFPSVLAASLAGLALWGIWQAAVGLDALQGDLEALSGAARAYAEERVTSRRAFASLPLPSHLAVLLATALPLLLARVRAGINGLLWGLAAAIALFGLAATRSPVGLGLALVATAMLVIGRHRRLAVAAASALLVALAVVLVARPDVARLEPIGLRIDNWTTGVWLWTTSPCAGVGLASFAQASQALPLAVGNRPAHAHCFPVELLAELGPIGVIACLCLAVGLGHVLRRLWPRDRALAAALVVVPLHNLVDFSFFVSGVALPWAVLLGWGWARGREDPAPPSDRRGRAVLVLVTATALAIATFHAASIVVEESAATLDDPAERFAGALQSHRLAPWRVEPQFLLASSAIETGRRSSIDQAWWIMSRWSWLRPASAALAERRAQVALARGDLALAAAELWSAVHHGAHDRVREERLETLLVALEGRSVGSSR